MADVMPEGTFVRTNRRYTVGGRNGYYNIDEYTVRGMMRNVDAFKTQKQAVLTASHLSQAYYDGFRDAHIGLILPLYRECSQTKYPRDGRDPETTIIPAGTLVKVLRKDSAAFFTCEVVETGLQFDCQFCDLREQPPVTE